MKQRIHKMKINNVAFPASHASDMAVIHRMFGEIEIVKVRQCLGGFNMKIWFKVKGANNE